jgi:nucleoside 2-deoxyribosyltransferase
MRVFIICTVRNASAEYRERLENYVADLERDGHLVHLPHRNTDQTQTGINICDQNRKAIQNADEIHIFYNPESQGTHFDMGVSFALNRKIKVVESVPLTPGKSYQNMLVEWEKSV